MKADVSLEEYFFGAATVGDRGQIVIPAEARKRLGINPGDKVLVMGHPVHSGLMLCKIDSMRELFSSFLRDLENIQTKMTESATEPNGN
jgi:AbrB family looped-hinge helix DNA binding protein